MQEFQKFLLCYLAKLQDKKEVCAERERKEKRSACANVPSLKWGPTPRGPKAPQGYHSYGTSHLRLSIPFNLMAPEAWITYSQHIYSSPAYTQKETSVCLLPAPIQCSRTGHRKRTDTKLDLRLKTEKCSVEGLCNLSCKKRGSTIEIQKLTWIIRIYREYQVNGTFVCFIL